MKNIPIIDIEASGLHFTSYPIEVAVLLKGESRSWLIKPEPSWQFWCNTAESMHGISRETLYKEGLPAVEVVAQLNKFLAGYAGDLYSDAHQWDADWLDKLYFAVKQQRPCFIASIYELLSSEQSQHFNDQKLELAALDRFRHHRAESDVWMLAEAFEKARHY
ncbi:DNA polymerase III, epsilon subunit [Alteromonadaceae bacterium Bs31]|nr:DNA polymerase III, epsilon subunit [Alteromonadaceae bacterium Bs31]